MKALVLGFAVILAAVLAILPVGLDWRGDVLAFLRGAFPVIAILIGLVLLFAGVSDIKDRAEARKDEKKDAE